MEQGKIDFNLFDGNDFTDPEPTYDVETMSLIRRRRLQILVHSYLYYQMNTSLVSDHVYDAWARELIDLQSAHPEEAKAAPYHADFDGFAMGDSFSLQVEQAWIHQKALELLRYKGES